MKTPLRIISIAALLTTLLAGCTNRQLYDSTQYLRIQDCEKLAGADRTQCMENARVPYPQYEKARQEAESGSKTPRE